MLNSTFPFFRRLRVWMVSIQAQWLFGMLALAWLVGVLVPYYVWHKPLSPALALTLLQSAWKVLVSAAILALAGGLGARLASLSHEPPLVRIALQGSLGLGLLSTGLLAIGITLGFNRWTLLGGLVAGLLLLARPVLSWLSDWREVGRLWRRSGRFGKMVGVGVGMILLIDLLTALAPPLKFDALVYHLSLPQIYLEAGRFVYVPEIMFWGMPQLGELLYTWAMALAGTQGAAVLGWMAAVLALAGLFGLVEAELGLRPAWVSLAALLSGFSLATSLAWGYVDWLTLLFGLGFLWALQSWWKNGERYWLMFAGGLAGFAFGVKYTAGILLFPGLLALLFSPPRIIKWNEKIQAAFEFLAPAALAAIPWLLKNLIATGNPVYPLFFPAGAMNALRLELYQGGEAWGGWEDVLFLPFRATIFGVEQAAGYSTSIGPLLLGLGLLAGLPGLVFKNHQHRDLIGSAAWIAIPVLVLWAIAGRFTGYLLQTRLYFSAFPAFAILAASGYRWVCQLRLPGVRLSRVASALILLVFGLNLLEVGTASVWQGALPFVLGQSTRGEYQGKNLGWYGPAMEAVRKLPEGSRVVMLWETRSLDCLPVCDPDEVIDRWLQVREQYGSGGAILDAWREAGYSHLLYYQAGAEFIREMDGFYTPADWQTLRVLLSSLEPVAHFSDTYILYSLKP